MLIRQALRGLAGVVGLEPTPIDLEDRCPHPLGDTPVILVVLAGVEPTTSRL